MGKISETLKNDVPAILKDIDRPELLDDRFEDLETQERLVAETKLRVMFLSNYVSSLRAAIEEKYIPISSIDHRRLIDAILLGTASERIAGLFLPPSSCSPRSILRSLLNRAYIHVWREAKPGATAGQSLHLI